MAGLFDEPKPKRAAKPKGPRRHRWVKLKLHHYCCSQCGMGRVNSDADGYWRSTWHYPDGRVRVEHKVPSPCEDGPETPTRLEKLQRLIDANKVVVDAGNWKAPF